MPNKYFSSDIWITKHLIPFITKYFFPVHIWHLILPDQEDPNPGIWGGGSLGATAVLRTLGTIMHSETNVDNYTI